MNLRGAHVNPHLRAISHGRLGHRVHGLFAVAFGVILAIAAGISALTAPSRPPQCATGRPCGSPPSVSSPLANETVWRSSQYGFTLEYPGDLLSVVRQTGGGLELGAQLKDGTVAAIIVRGAPVSESPSHAVLTQLGDLHGVTQIASDPDPANTLLGSGVGHRAGTGGAYTGALSAPQGVSQAESIASQAASNGRVTITATVVAASPDAGPHHGVYQVADAIVNSVKWSTG